MAPTERSQHGSKLRKAKLRLLGKISGLLKSILPMRISTQGNQVTIVTVLTCFPDSSLPLRKCEPVASTVKGESVQVILVFNRPIPKTHGGVSVFLNAFVFSKHLRLPLDVSFIPWLCHF